MFIAMPKLSIVIPVYNEKKTILSLIQTVLAVPLEGLEKEIVIVDDCSKDGTIDLLKNFQDERVRIFYHEKNRGKGAALRTGFAHATGDFVIIQDADLEYDPGEYPLLLQPLLAGKADVVFGSRFIGDRPHRVLFFWHSLGNKILTIFSNVMTDLNLTDMETCYKVFSKESLQKILPKLRSERFNIEPEITALVARENLRIFEVGISYYGRTYAEGKKIGWRDGFSAIWAIIKFNLLK